MSLQEMIDAAKRNDAATVRQCLAEGCDINAAGADNNNALVWAAHSNALDVLRLLLERGASLDVKSGSGYSPIDVAMRARNTAAAALLKEGATASEEWVPMGAGTVAHVGHYRQLEKKITQVFNFATRERVMMTENLRTKVELLSQPTSFDDLPRSAVETAFGEFTRRGGKADRDFVLDGREPLGKTRKDGVERPALSALK